MPVSLNVTNQTSLRELQQFLAKGDDDAKIYGRESRGVVTLYLKPQPEGKVGLGTKLKEGLQRMFGIAANRRNLARGALEGIMTRFNSDVVSNATKNLIQDNEDHQGFSEWLNKLTSGIASQTKGHELQETKANRVGRVKLYATALTQIAEHAKIETREAPVNVGGQVNDICRRFEMPETICEAQLKGRAGDEADGKTQVKAPPSPSTTPTTATPITIDGTRYLPVKFLARGGFGDVFKYKAVDSEKIIAVKISNTNDPAKLKEAAKEIQSHAELTKNAGDSVVKLLGATQQPGGNIVIASEFAPNGDLNDLATKLSSAEANAELPMLSGQISAQQKKAVVLTLLQDMAKGLHSIHSQTGLTHYDFKNPNILIDENGVGKVTDFGTTFSGSSVRFGDTTPIESAAYKAPELSFTRNAYNQGKSLIETNVSSGLKELSENLKRIYPGQKLEDVFTSITFETQKVALKETPTPLMKQVDKADVWGLGASAYQLFTGKLILFGFSKYVDQQENRLAAFHEQIGGKAIAPNGFEGNVFAESLAASTGDEEVDNFLNWVLAPKPEDRPSTGTILKHEIFKSKGVGSEASRELIKALAQGNTEGIDIARDRLNEVL